ncbi:hypothetical protein [Hwanghaeella sp.]|uniref:hypothetical protein n=1 Tax=Hwanghaeella sp. TaxID=2605943 RepID=UPI003CCBFEE9
MSELALAYVPVVGFLAWRARRGGATDWVYFAVNVLLLWFSALWVFGYPLLIVTMLSAAVIVLTALVFSTSTDMFTWPFLRRR